MDTLTSINVFGQVAESGSFVGAADRLHLSTANLVVEPGVRSQEQNGLTTNPRRRVPEGRVAALAC